MTKSPRFLPDLPFGSDRPRRVEIVAYPDVQLLDVAGPLQVFATANDLRPAGSSPPYTLAVVAPAAGVLSSAGLGLATAPLPRDAAPVDTLIVAGGRGVHAAAETDLPDWIAGRAAQADRVASVCTGAFLLGAAGLLHGRRVATHWTACDALARRYPAACVEPDPIFIRDGTLWTSAGVSAGIDLALALVEADLGRAVALAVARHLVVFLKRPGGQAQFSTALSLQAGSRFDALHAWIGENLAEPLTVERLAAQAGMSPRSFARHYRIATGLTPARALERLRVDAARRHLAESRMPLKRIALICGFGSEETLRRSVQRCIGAAPGAYRRRFPGEEAPDPRRI
ncbi:GlxA family transcriptional regulator [Methylobacterium gossipiicola]|uniref:Transcriptional regulator GlxA family, contains an amidase domain and an AraC-type DNA-binding HTH domain n=1 Tax=Methylobacterium gossipiicola TaxID=582675 RepID=A0A1I2SLD1_9HYPH|nr:helix-turn-helix domain-containing protein [Methylobacterium gossipiicola]SFG50701.1 Transcriptional regulator GlxA family, contains an amidase domain and an AraC-type DNA-binding HTH domain [Methylobacterium gossipiicola]